MKLRLGVEPGLETRQPEAAADRYEAAVQAGGGRLKGKRILLLGYGGYFGLAVSFLERGVSHVVLVDPYARVNDEMNLALAQRETLFLSIEDGQVIPREEWITVDPNFLKDVILTEHDKIDFIFSSSVLEHVSNPDELIRDLSRITHPEGLNVHFIDLRDHFFKYPFEMLCHSDRVWSRFLNPTSNLNRLRVWNYEDIFRRYFQKVELEIFERELATFEKTKRRIRPEFVSGDIEADCAARLRVNASLPLIET
jgi:SAM-dependent methyltransferase